MYECEIESFNPGVGNYSITSAHIPLYKRSSCGEGEEQKVEQQVVGPNDCDCGNTNSDRSPKIEHSNAGYYTNLRKAKEQNRETERCSQEEKLRKFSDAV